MTLRGSANNLGRFGNVWLDRTEARSMTAISTELFVKVDVP